MMALLHVMALPGAPLGVSLVPHEPLTPHAVTKVQKGSACKWCRRGLGVCGAWPPCLAVLRC